RPRRAPGPRGALGRQLPLAERSAAAVRPRPLRRSRGRGGRDAWGAALPLAGTRERAAARAGSRRRKPRGRAPPVTLSLSRSVRRCAALALALVPGLVSAEDPAVSRPQLKAPESVEPFLKQIEP